MRAIVSPGGAQCVPSLCAVRKPTAARQERESQREIRARKPVGDDAEFFFILFFIFDTSLHYRRHLVLESPHVSPNARGSRTRDVPTTPRSGEGRFILNSKSYNICRRDSIIYRTRRRPLNAYLKKKKIPLFESPSPLQTAIIHRYSCKLLYRFCRA